MGIKGLIWKKKETAEEVKANNAVALSKDEAKWIFSILREMHSMYPDDRDIKISLSIMERAIGE